MESQQTPFYTHIVREFEYIFGNKSYIFEKSIGKSKEEMILEHCIEPKTQAELRDLLDYSQAKGQ